MDIKQLTKTYEGKLVVSDVTFEIPKNKVTSFIGPNGAGKSTVLNIITRLIGGDSGEVSLDDIDMKKCKSKDLAKKIAILTQTNNVQMKLTVRELVAIGRFPYRWSNIDKEDYKKVDEAIANM